MKLNELINAYSLGDNAFREYGESILIKVQDAKVSYSFLQGVNETLKIYLKQENKKRTSLLKIIKRLPSYKDLNTDHLLTILRNLCISENISIVFQEDIVEVTSSSFCKIIRPNNYLELIPEFNFETIHQELISFYINKISAILIKIGNYNSYSGKSILGQSQIDRINFIKKSCDLLKNSKLDQNEIEKLRTILLESENLVTNEKNFTKLIKEISSINLKIEKIIS